MELDASQPWEIDLLREFCCSDGSLEDLGYARRSILASSWFLAKQHPSPQPSVSLCGQGREEGCVVRQWVEFYSTRLRQGTRWDSPDKDKLEAVLKELNAHLADCIFFVGGRLSLADLLLYYGLHRYMAEMAFSEKAKFVHLCRWFDHVQNFPGVRPLSLSLLVFHKAPTLLQIV